jgi:hypothetical protein
MLTKSKDWSYESEWRIIDSVESSGYKDIHQAKISKNKFELEIE